eukprot:TRINITY_DN6122_c0_g1_i2.p1 TRINITY_DN6122_c0_g1~~TRINITY_DN6122_c0_g1_i2.p1  ORF type:complete len:328 (-),score=21.74 TRINITY_DN6122_c0_g1_i2:3-986(-)
MSWGNNFNTGRSLFDAAEYCDLKDELEKAPDFAESLEDMNAFSIVLGVFLWFAGMAALLPQHLKLWNTKSSAGLSYVMLFLGNINQMSSVINATILKFPQIRACGEVGIWECSPSLLTLYQLSGIWLATFPVYILYIVFFLNTEEFKLDPVKRARDWLLCRVLLGLFILYTVVMFGIGISFLASFGECGKATINFGWSVGILGTICTFIQWTPQIISTFRLKAVGSYSLLTLAIQAPGTLVVVYFLLFLSNEDISTWLAYLTAGIQQFVLLGLLSWYHFKGKQAPGGPVIESLERGQSDEESDNEATQLNERTSLLQWGLGKVRPKS